MKRHQSLYPLSHEHHHALVHARDLDSAGASGDRANIQEVAARFIGFWKSDLQMRIAREEQIVLPLLANHMGAEAAEIRETLEQHSAILRLIDELNEKLARRETIEANLLINIAESLRRHIRYEESELFPAVEAAVPEVELRLMNMRLSGSRNHGGDEG